MNKYDTKQKTQKAVFRKQKGDTIICIKNIQ